MDPAFERLAGIAFGRFQLLPDRRELLADGRPVKLGGRAFVLMALIEARGAVVSKEALMTRVWAGRIIQENSLGSQIAALRAAFGAQSPDAAINSPARSAFCRRARSGPERGWRRRSLHRSSRRRTYQSRFPS
jgi:hypothetical protein